MTTATILPRTTSRPDATTIPRVTSTGTVSRGRVVTVSRGRPAQHAARSTPDWLLTVWAALAALAVCVVAVFYTPVVTPAAWRSAESSVVAVARHAAEGLDL